MKIIYVPPALRAVLEAAGVGAKDLLDVEKLVGILSPEDVAFYSFLQMRLGKVLPAEIHTSFASALCNQDGCAAAEKVLGPYQATDRKMKEFQRVLQEYCLNDSAPQLNLTGMHLTSDVMDENTIRFTHTPMASGDEPDSTVAGMRDLLDRVIQQLHAFLPFEKLARLPLLTGYLNASQAFMAADASTSNVGA